VAAQVREITTVDPVEALTQCVGQAERSDLLCLVAPGLHIAEVNAHPLRRGLLHREGELQPALPARGQEHRHTGKQEQRQEQWFEADDRRGEGHDPGDATHQADQALSELVRAHQPVVWIRCKRS
jgi:hypothetical protein